MSNLRDGLEETPYGELKNKFIELGIGEAFKPGLKKIILIEKAIELVEKKEELPDGATLEEIEADIARDKDIDFDSELYKFNQAVKAVTSTKGIWTKETIEKRIVVLGNIFLQNRTSIKGTEALAKQKVLDAAAKLMF